ncbi:MAG TPA: phosphatidylglycerol lysyltransferase domain-containing protein [bacterium]|nr:phosphatidylglycerol lysyltransferase domain-containing protein [bacterium]
MPLIPLLHADFFDSVEPLDSGLERASSFHSTASALSTSLPSFLMWQDEFTYAFATKGGASFIIALYGKYAYFPVPPKPFTADNLRTAFEYMKKINGQGPGISRIEGLGEGEKTRAEEWGFPSRPTLMEYLYDRGQVAGLHGDPYRAKRAEINHLLKENSIVLRPYRKDDLKACGELFETWKNQRLPGLKGEMSERMLLSSQKAHFQALHQGGDWGMDAWVVLLENRLAAYSVGAALGPDTYGIYLEVTDLTVKGLSAYIFTNICRQVESYAWINAGDAEGLPRLAESKQHWHPAGKIRLFAVDPQ